MPGHIDRAVLVTPTRAFVLATVWLAAACPSSTPETPDPIPGYVLTLQPQVLAGADPFAGGPDVSLVLIQDNDIDVVFLGAADGNLSMPELPLLRAGDAVGILVESAGGNAEAWDPELTLGYGQVVLEADLPTDGGSVDLDILVTPYGELPAAGVLGGSDGRYLAGVAMAPGGDVFLFGGAKTGIGASAAKNIFVLSDTDAGNVVMEKLEVTMPQNTFGVLNRVEGDTYAGVSAILVDDEDGPLILVTGGRPDWTSAAFNSESAYFFDPVARDWVMDGEEPLTLKMKIAMSGHRHVRMANGDLMFYGGLIDDASVATVVQLYDVGARRFIEVATNAVTSALYEPSAASLGPLGAIVCGGTDLPVDQDFGTWPAFDTCFRVSYDGDLTSLASLPEAMALHAMVELADGRVLATGGVLDGLPGGQATPGDATARAWLYDPSTDRWSEVGAMVHARAGHAIVALPDGSALVIGGVDAATAQEGGTGDPIACWERFDLASETFIDGDCNGAGEGLWPRVTTAPGDGGFAIAGYWRDNEIHVPGGYGLFATGLP